MNNSDFPDDPSDDGYILHMFQSLFAAYFV